MSGSPATVVACESTTTKAPTIWGLTPVEVHDRFWASRGVEVVRRGEQSELSSSAELYLLADPKTLVIFRLRDLVELLSWLKPKLLVVRLRDECHHEYREVVRVADDGSLLRSERIYEGLGARLARIGVTPSRDVAASWQQAPGASDGWTGLRRSLPPQARISRSMPGRVFDASRDEQVMAHLECLMESWTQPDSTIPRARRGPARSWVDRDARLDPRASVTGTVWVGAGRSIAPTDTVLGPAILWDDPAFRPATGVVPWRELEPATLRPGVALQHRPTRASRVGKRLFDLGFSLLALAFTLPLYPLIALAIWLEDGWPIFFAHRRETLGGREFPCLKFRSMRRNAESAKVQIAAKNVADGPQFYVERDPRSTRVGRFLRTTQLDEVPQFLNVLLGHMSVVGPRPSPRRENQFCPAWREARLSVRPGITGLWQIRRTRAAGRDFQEWIQYDLEYVERMSWRFDLWILWKTCGTVLRRALGR